jgi:hypothetical protein
MNGPIVVSLLALIAATMIAVMEYRTARKLENRNASLEQEVQAWRASDARRVVRSIKFEPTASVSLKEFGEVRR